MAATANLTIVQGDTFVRVVRWESPTPVFKAITAITQAAPVAITAAAHNLSTGWRACVVSAKGMTAINAKNTPPKTSDLKRVTVTNANTITFPEVDASLYKAYTSGGYLYYFDSVDLTGYTARMAIKDKVGGSVLITLTDASGITISAVDRTVTITISATATAALTWKKGVYDLEMVSPVGVVEKIFTGSVVVTPEVTT